MEFVDLKAQYRRYQEDIDSRMRRVLAHGRFIMGPEIEEIEQALASYVGVRHCISVSSGTASLEIALRALGIGPGDEVITVAFSWISTAEVIRLVGAKPIFVDIRPDTYLIDTGAMEDAISPQTRAILPVSLFGQMPDMGRIQTVASRYSLAVIEDGAQSLGASQNGRLSCGASLLGSTSFFPAKTLGCYGDGGALFTSDDALAERIRAIRNHGGLERNHHTEVGTNGRFDTLQAAVLLAKLPHLDEELARRRAAADYYTDGLVQELGGRCSPPLTIEGNSHAYGQYTIRVRDRDSVRAHLLSAGIPTAVYYPKGLHEQPVFASDLRPGDLFPETEAATREVLSIPMHPFLTRDDQDQVIAALKQAIVR